MCLLSGHTNAQSSTGPLFFRRGNICCDFGGQRYCWVTHTDKQGAIGEEFSTVLWFFRKGAGLSIIFWFWHLFLASWHFDHFGIFGIFDILALWDSKENSIKREDAKIKATMVFNDVFFDLKMPKCQKCQRCQNGQNAKMQKKCQNSKRRKNASPLKKMPTMPRCQNQRNQGDIWDISWCCV